MIESFAAKRKEFFDSLLVGYKIEYLPAEAVYSHRVMIIDSSTYYRYLDNLGMDTVNECIDQEIRSVRAQLIDTLDRIRPSCDLSVLHICDLTLSFATNTVMYPAPTLETRTRLVMLAPKLKVVTNMIFTE